MYNSNRIISSAMQAIIVPLSPSFSFKASAQASIAPAVGIYLLHRHRRHQTLTVGFKGPELIRPGRCIVRLRRGGHEEGGMMR